MGAYSLATHFLQAPKRRNNVVLAGYLDRLLGLCFFLRCRVSGRPSEGHASLSKAIAQEDVARQNEIIGQPPV